MARTGGHPRNYDYEELEADNDYVVDFGGKPAPAFKLVNGEAVEDASPFAPEDDAEQGDEYGHDENLAESLDEDYLSQLGMDLVELVEQDITDRAPWRSRFERGMEMLGLVESDIDDGPFPGASNAVHPMILDAVTQFWARATAEFIPSEGPAKIKVNGQQTQEMLDKADRVKEFMNWDMMTADSGYVSEKSRMFWALPWAGSAFFKTFPDPVTGQVTGIYVPAEDMILHSSSADLRSTPRFTHRMKKRMNEIRAMQLSGYYREVDLRLPADEETDEVEAVKNEISDVAPSNLDDSDNRLTLYETLMELDLPGHEHKDERGQPTGLELPYYVTVDTESQQVLAIRRGFKQDDPTYRRCIYVRKYDFVPGPGPYGLGFFHLIGGLQAAGTGALRVMLDGAAAASLSGGFISKNANLKGKRIIFEPGVWHPVDASGDDLSKAFVQPPVKEPAPALFQMLGFVTDAANKIAATTDMMTGNADSKNAPVGSTVALLEQGQKVMSTIHRLIHAEFARELKDRYDFLSTNPPAEGYPYEIGGDERTVFAEDFAKGLEIAPVSDPNIFSSVQRIQISQAVMQAAAENPDIVNRRVALKRFFKDMKVPDVDELIEDEPEATPYDANGEVQAILMGKPVKVLPEQNHVAHLQGLVAFAQNPQFGGNPQVMEQIGPALMTVIANHMAYAWATHARQAGVPAGYLDPESGQMSQPEVPPEQLTQMIAQIAPMLAQAPGIPAPQEEQQGDPAAQAKIELEQAKTQGEQQKLGLKQQEHEMKMAHEQQKMAWEQEREQLKLQVEQAKAEAKLQIEQMKGQVQIQATQQKAQIDAQMAEQQMAHDQQNMARQSQMDEQRMAQESEMMQREGQMKEQQMGQQMQHAERKSRLDELRQPAGGNDQGGM